MKNTAELPISTLKVDFGCTNGCQTDVKKTLQELKGVKTISVDPEQGKVVVVGNVNPMVLIKLLQKMGRKAQLWSFDKEPKEKGASKEKGACSHHAKKKHHSHRCHESSDTEDESETEHVYGHNHKTHHNQRSNKMHDQNNMFNSVNQHAQPPPAARHQQAHPPPFVGLPHAPPPQAAGYRQPPPPPFAAFHHGPPTPPMSGYQPFSGYRPPMPWYQPQHVAYGRPPPMYPRPVPLHGYNGYGPPMGPPYGQYGSMFPEPNPMIHYNSYADNYHYTPYR